jgi:ATP-dependent DNA helicase RecG
MEAIKSTQNGFTLSKLDLEIRGPGDFFGTAQRGFPEMKITNLYRDMDVLKNVQGEIEQMNADEMKRALLMLKPAKVSEIAVL